MSADQILFFDNLNEISGGDESFNKELLVLFCTSSKETLANMDLSIQQKDFELFGKLAHKIKFSINLIGSEELKQIVLDLENNNEYPQNETLNRYQVFKTKVQLMIDYIEAEYQ